MIRGALMLAFLLSGYLTFGQSVEYKVSASLHYPFIPSGLVVKEYMSTSSGTYVEEMNGSSNEFNDLYNYYKYYTKETSSTAFKSKGGIKFGGGLSYSLNQQFSLETGLMINLTRFDYFVKRTSTTYCEGNCDTFVPKDEYAKDDSGNSIVGPDGEEVPMHFYYPDTDYYTDGEQQESASQEEDSSSGLSGSSTHISNSIIYIDIPVTTKYAVWNDLKLEGGFLTSLLAFSDQAVNRIQAEEKFEEKEFNKILFALRGAISYPINQNVEIEAGYNRYLSSIYEEVADEIAPKYHFFNLGLTYKIKN